jgi:ankyrin repeat protein
MASCVRSNRALVPILLEHQPQINVYNKVPHKPQVYFFGPRIRFTFVQEHMTALLYAVKAGDRDVVEMLLGHGADPNMHDKVQFSSVVSYEG